MQPFRVPYGRAFTAAEAKTLSATLTDLLQRVGNRGEIIEAPRRNFDGSLWQGDHTGNAWANLPFRAEITGRSGTLYSWKAQTAYSSTSWIDFDGALSGTTSVHPAYEANGNIVPTGAIVQMRRAYFDSTYDWVYVFDWVPSSGSTIAAPVTVKATTTTYNAPTTVLTELVSGTVPADEVAGFGKSVVQKLTLTDGSEFTVQTTTTTFANTPTAGAQLVTHAETVTDYGGTYTYLTTTTDGTGTATTIPGKTLVLKPTTSVTIGDNTSGTAVINPVTSTTVGNNQTGSVTVNPTTSTTVGNNQTTTVTVNPSTTAAVGNNQTTTVTLNPTTTLNVGNAQTTNVILRPSGSNPVTIGGGTSATPLRFLEPSGSGSNYIQFTAPAMAGDTSYTLPNAYPGADGYSLTSTTGGVLSWSNISGGTGITIGSAITGGTASRILYEDASNNLAESAFLVWVESSKRLVLDDSGGGGSVATIDVAGANSVAQFGNGSIAVTLVDPTGNTAATFGDGTGTATICSASYSLDVAGRDVRITDVDIVLGTANGTKIGTATTQKIGFFNKTPVVQLAKASYNNWAAFTDVVQALVDIGLFDTA